MSIFDLCDTLSTVNLNELRVLVIGDPHFKVSNAQESEEMTTKLCDLASTLNLDMIVCLGDILDRHETIHVAPLMRATYFLKRLSEIAPLYMMIGNHDRPNNSNFLTNEHPFNALKHWPQTTVVDIVVDTKIKGYRLVFVPYVAPGRFMDALNTIQDPLTNTTAIFAHQEFYGAKMGAIVSQVGDPWPLNNPLCISGHIHDFDELQSNLFYVGTPMQHAFGDGSHKTVSLFTFTGKHFEHQRLDLKLTKRIIVYLEPSQVPTYTPPDNTLVKLVISGTAAELKVIVKLPQIKELTKRGIKISYKQVDHSNSTSEVKVNAGKQMRYLERLYHEISSDAKQVKWYEQLFGKFTTTGIL